MSSIFTKIISGELPSYRIDETDDCFAFLDINPNQKGHTLCVLKKEIDYIFDLPENLLAEMMVFSKSVAKKIEKSIECDRIGVSVIGLEVSHAHIHLIPINSIADMDFSKEKLKLSHEEFIKVAALINS